MDDNEDIVEKLHREAWNAPGALKTQRLMRNKRRTSATGSGKRTGIRAVNTSSFESRSLTTKSIVPSPWPL
jgi:hypothetical protein